MCFYKLKFLYQPPLLIIKVHPLFKDFFLVDLIDHQASRVDHVRKTFFKLVWSGFPFLLGPIGLSKRFVTFRQYIDSGA